MIDIIYYSIKKVPDTFSLKKALPNNILEYVKNKYLANLNSSLFAWSLLNELSNFDLTKVTFLKSGKPIIDGASFSISHSKGYVAIAFSNSPINLGIDIERIENRNLEFLNRLSNTFTLADNDVKFKLWTEREATVKALNLKLLTETDTVFKGFSKTVTTVDGEFSLSIYYDSEMELMEKL